MTKKKIILLFFLLIVIISGLKAQIKGFQRTYGLPGFNYGVSSFQTSDKGYMILGNKSGFIGNTDIYIIKTDSNGYLQWDKAIGDDALMIATDFKQTPDKGLIISGYTNGLTTQSYDFLIIKTDSLANIEWKKSFGGSDWDFAYSVAVIPNTAYFIAGKTYDNTHGMADGFLAGIALNGDTLWTKTIGGAGEDVINSIDTTLDGNLIAAGYTNSSGNGGFDFFLIKITPAGNVLWTKTYGQEGDEKAYCARATVDGGFVIIGSSNSPPAINLDPWLVKTNNIGDSLWNYYYFNNKDEEFFDIKQLNNGNYLLAGYTTTWGLGGKDLFTHLVGPTGDFLNGTTYGGDHDDIAYSCGVASDNGYFFTGTTESKGLGLSNIYFIKTNEYCYTDTNSIHIMAVQNEKYDDFSINIFPNPASYFINVIIENITDRNIKICIYDMYGKIIYTSYENVFDKKILYKQNIESLIPGIYFININTSKINKTLKFIVN